jgi:hypothetical protein
MIVMRDGRTSRMVEDNKTKWRNKNKVISGFNKSTHNIN